MRKSTDKLTEKELLMEKIANATRHEHVWLNPTSQTLDMAPSCGFHLYRRAIFVTPIASFKSWKCTKIVGGWNFAPDYTEGAYSANQTYFQFLSVPPPFLDLPLI